MCSTVGFREMFGEIVFALFPSVVAACDAVVAVRSMAAAASRRRGLGDPRGLAGRASALVGVQLWRRAAAMVAACVPATASRDLGGVLATARTQRLGELGLGAPAAAAGA